jgi:hypothetical protein
LPAEHAWHTPGSVAPYPVWYRPAPQTEQSHSVSSRPTPYVPGKQGVHCRDPWLGMQIQEQQKN